MLLAGRTISHFHVLEKLGEGGMGVVYKARDAHLDRSVALKILPPDKVADAERRRRFVQEAKAASALNHPGIVTIYDIDEAEGVYFIAMEYVAGKTLDRIIGRKGLPLRTVLGYAVQIADALACAHGAGVVHRDLKPANIMVTDDGSVKILDFGLAKLMEPASAGEAQTRTLGRTEAAVTDEGRIVGTFAYMSPEQAQGKTVDARSDIFSFGAVLFEMLTGRSAFHGGTAMATAAAILNQEPGPAGAPAELERALTRCLRKDPRRRWQTMSDLKVALQELKEESDSGSLAGAPSMAAAPRQKLLAWGLAAVALLAAASILTWWLTRKPAARASFETERLTFESGLAGVPAISRDGKLLAYSSDRDGPFQLYVQQVGGGQSIRLTHGDATDWMADFSPDGSKIVFRSERDGGGLYEVGALGGAERKIADYGWSHRFSPDGSTIAYVMRPALINRGKVYLVGINGGIPKPLQPGLTVAAVGPMQSPPTWSPDGQWLLIDGFSDKEPGKRDWWAAPLAGGEAVRMTEPAMSSTQMMIRSLVAWRGKDVYFSEGSVVGGMSIYRVPIDGPPWRVSGAPERITSPLGMQMAGTISADGRLVFSSWTPAVNFWSVPLRANAGTTSGEPQQLTADSSFKLSLAGAANGSKLVYVRIAEGQRAEIRLRDMPSGREQAIPGAGTYAMMYPHLSADGSRLAWRDMVEGKVVSFVLEPGQASPRRLCENCPVFAFFPDGSEILLASDGKLLRQNLATGARTVLLDLAGINLYEAKVSGDARWFGFTQVRPDGMAAILIAPLGQQPAARESWIQIAEDRSLLRGPAWSPDGRLVYYESMRDGHDCFWAQRVTAAGRPVGSPMAVLHRHGTLEGMFYAGAMVVLPDRLYMTRMEIRGNIWMAKVDR